MKKARRALTELATSTGGIAFFPENVDGYGDHLRPDRPRHPQSIHGRLITRPNRPTRPFRAVQVACSQQPQHGAKLSGAHPHRLLRPRPRLIPSPATKRPPDSAAERRPSCVIPSERSELCCASDAKPFLMSFRVSGASESLLFSRRGYRGRRRLSHRCWRSSLRFAAQQSPPENSPVRNRSAEILRHRLPHVGQRRAHA